MFKFTAVTFALAASALVANVSAFKVDGVNATLLPPSNLSGELLRDGCCTAANKGNCVSYARCLVALDGHTMPHLFSDCAAKKKNSHTAPSDGREGCVLFRTNSNNWCHAEYIHVSGAVGSTYALKQSNWPKASSGCTTTTLPKGDSVIIGIWCPP